MGKPFMNEKSFTHVDMMADHMADMVNKCVSEHASKPAFSCVLPTGHSQTLDFKTIGALSDAVAAYLREEIGLVPGDVVAIQSPNALAYPVLAFGVFKAGLTITNINPLYTPAETNHQLKDSGAKVWFVIDFFGDRIAESTEGSSVEFIYKLSVLDFFPPLQRHVLGFVMRHIKKLIPPFHGDCAGTMVDVIKKGQAHLKRGADLASYTKHISLDDVALYQYTGGTTGRSKGAELTHRNVVANISQTNSLENGVDWDERDALILVLPLYHVYALAVGALNSMFMGVHVVLVPAPRPLENLKPVFSKFDITLMPGVNTLYVGLLQQNWFTENPPKSLRVCMSGAAPLQAATAKAWQDLTGIEIYEGYGLTEGTCVIATMPFDKPPKRGTCGIPIPGTSVRIVDENGKDMAVGEAGELWLKGPQIMRGYLNSPDANEVSFSDGWLKTGDIAVMDEDGYLSIVDRIKDMVIVSGFNVYPTDIEDVLTLNPQVDEAAVIGVSDSKTGEQVVAYVVAKNNAVTAESIIEHCKEHLTNYKVPKTVCFVDALPKSPVGKILRRELRDQHSQ